VAIIRGLIFARQPVANYVTAVVFIVLGSALSLFLIADGKPLTEVVAAAGLILFGVGYLLAMTQAREMLREDERRRL
jgi:hypothetical protein